MAQTKDGETHETKPTLGSNALIESIRGIYNGTVAPLQCRQQKEFADLGFTYITPPFAKGHYTAFFRALKSKSEHIIVKILDLSKLKPMYKNQTIDESCKILDYVSRKENLANVVRIYGQFLVGDTLYVFMRNYTDRSVHFKMRVVARFKETLVRQWARQLGSVCRYLEAKGIVHRSLRVEHLLLDEHDNLNLTGWTRSIFLLNPNNFQLNKCNREYRCRKRNHLPQEAFVGSKHSPEYIDQWSFGVIIVNLSTNRHPFVPKALDKKDFEQQWKEFVSKHGAMIDASVLSILGRLFVTQESDRPSLATMLSVEYLTMPQRMDAKQSTKKTTVTKAPVQEVAPSTLKTMDPILSKQQQNVSLKKSQKSKFEPIPPKMGSKSSKTTSPSSSSKKGKVVKASTVSSKATSTTTTTPTKPLHQSAPLAVETGTSTNSSKPESNLANQPSPEIKSVVDGIVEKSTNTEKATTPFNVSPGVDDSGQKKSTPKQNKSRPDEHNLPVMPSPLSTKPVADKPSPTFGTTLGSTPPSSIIEKVTTSVTSNSTSIKSNSEGASSSVKSNNMKFNSLDSHQ